MKVETEYIRGLRFKLRIMGIPCTEPAYIYGYNQSVIANTTMPHSVLKKKSNSITFHFVKEVSVKDEWRTDYINTNENPADMMTKPFPSGENHTNFTRMILHHI